ncbi:hypothetical protein FVEG_16241 [Fusarium verticillioides 7600]|uniref:Uncharacterized protein n=1 Tax=Gibberella moniliformis (strain M3125 / FGSC 7600) TaxID=334819 RepID=W7MB24_GIBM7|nr:hypothetical protein FVEG_16241 [Fusarium verticillioides 7600]EWG48206.1 hypothetical protein FVEG_16241 [Fusarium verticillioides 7600]
MNDDKKDIGQEVGVDYQHIWRYLENIKSSNNAAPRYWTEDGTGFVQLLIEPVNKLAHSETCAWTLVKLSRTYSILGDTSTIPARLDETAFGKLPAETMIFKLEEHLKTLRKEYNTN